MVVLRALGCFDVRSGSGSTLTPILLQPKRAALLAYLAIARPQELHRRDSLLALFWPDSDEAHGRNALSQSLSFLRRELGSDVLRTRGTEEVGVDPLGVTSDVGDFTAALAAECWADALDAYHGDLLEGLHVKGAGPFLDWLDRERERLRQAAADAGWRAAHSHIAAGRVNDAELSAERALSLVPTHESRVRVFIEALAGAGDRAAALRFYERFKNVLATELEIEPAPETASVVEAVRSRTKAVRVPTVVPLSVGAAAHPHATAPPEGPRRWNARLGWTLAAASLAAVLWVVSGQAPGLISPGPPERDSWHLDPSVVAVAPFANRTGDPAFDALGTRLAVSLQGALDRTGIGEVVPPHVVERALLDAGARSDAVTVLASTLGAGIVVKGDIFVRADSLLVRAYCIDSWTDEDLYPLEPAVGPRDEDGLVVARIRSRVSAVLAQHFDRRFAFELDVVPPPVNPQAYREFQRGYELYALGGSHQDAMAQFRKAWELDPDYLAPPLRLLAFYSVPSRDHQLYDSIRTALERSRSRMTPYQKRYFDGIRLAVEGQTELAYRQFLAMADIGRLRAASSLAEMALLTNRPHKSVEAAGWLDKGGGEFLEPYVAFWQGYWSTYTYALHLAGSYEKELEIALEWHRRFPAADYYPVQAETKARVGLGQLELLRPVVDRWRREKRLQAIWDLSDELRVHGHQDAARILLEEEVLRFETDSGYAGRLNNQAMVLHRLGRDREAHRLWEAEINLDRPDPWPWGVARIGFSAALIGDTAQARAMERLLLAIPGPREGDYTPFLQAKIAAALGEKGRAVAILTEWARRGSNLAWVNNVHRDFTLQSLLADSPAFQELMRPKG